MQKIRYYLAVIALLGTLIGSLVQGMGLGSMANAASSRHASSVSSSVVVGQLTSSAFAKPYVPCTVPSLSDC